MNRTRSQHSQKFISRQPRYSGGLNLLLEFLSGRGGLFFTMWIAIGALCYSLSQPGVKNEFYLGITGIAGAVAGALAPKHEKENNSGQQEDEQAIQAEFTSSLAERDVEEEGKPDNKFAQRVKPIRTVKPESDDLDIRPQQLPTAINNSVNNSNSKTSEFDDPP